MRFVEPPIKRNRQIVWVVGSGFRCRSLEGLLQQQVIVEGWERRVLLRPPAPMIEETSSSYYWSGVVLIEI